MKTRHGTYGWAIAAAVVAAAAGCGDARSQYDATVQGTVTIDGELAPGGTVTFYPAKKGPAAVGEIARDGSFALRVGQGNAGDQNRSKIPSGEYIATVSVQGPSSKDDVVAEGGPPKAGPRLVADKYVAKETSDLKFTIKPGANVLALKVEGPSANPPVEPTEEAAAGEAAAPAEGQASPTELGPTAPPPSDAAATPLEDSASPTDPAATDPPATPPAETQSPAETAGPGTAGESSPTDGNDFAAPPVDASSASETPATEEKPE